MACWADIEESILRIVTVGFVDVVCELMVCFWNSSLMIIEFVGLRMWLVKLGGEEVRASCPTKLFILWKKTEGFLLDNE